jgi:hypothetical protein
MFCLQQDFDYEQTAFASYNCCSYLTCDIVSELKPDQKLKTTVEIIN